MARSGAIIGAGEASAALAGAPGDRPPADCGKSGPAVGRTPAVCGDAASATGNTSGSRNANGSEEGSVAFERIAVSIDVQTHRSRCGGRCYARARLRVLRTDDFTTRAAVPDERGIPICG